MQIPITKRHKVESPSSGWSTSMPDNFQAEPPRWSSERPPAFDRYAEVNLRKPEKQTVRRVTISVAAALVSGVVMAAVVLGLVLFSGKRPTPVPVAASPGGSVSAPPRAVAVAAPAPPALLPAEEWPEPADRIVRPVENKEVAPLQGTWIATAVTVNGEEANDDDVAKVKLTMDKEGFKMVLPTTQKEGRNWATGFVTPEGNKGILFLPGGGDDMRGIYKIDGDNLRVCITALSDNWPDDFTAKKDSKRTLLILKRKEP